MSNTYKIGRDMQLKYDGFYGMVGDGVGIFVLFGALWRQCFLLLRSIM